jgi:SRSO17 transposase
MTARRPCPPAPGPLEDYATQFNPLLASVAQRRGFRDYLQGLLAPRDRNKTLTGLADAEPITGAQHRGVQRLQWFLSESAWDHEVVPYTPASRRPGGQRDPGFRTTPQLAVELVQAAREAGIEFWAVVADCSMATIPASPTRCDRQGALRAGPQARQRYLGAGRPSPHSGRGGQRPRLAQPHQTWSVTAHPFVVGPMRPAAAKR